jgi:hypothetical protein
MGKSAAGAVSYLRRQARMAGSLGCWRVPRRLLMRLDHCPCRSPSPKKREESIGTPDRGRIGENPVRARMAADPLF